MQVGPTVWSISSSVGYRRQRKFKHDQQCQQEALRREESQIQTLPKSYYFDED